MSAPAREAPVRTTRTARRAATRPGPVRIDRRDRIDHGDRQAGGPLVGSPGQALPEPIRIALEDLLGHDLRDIRIHADPIAADAAQAVQAAAFVWGRHVFFGPGRYDPTTSVGRRLLAHEVAHAVQAPQPASLRTDPARLEALAEAQADLMASRDWHTGPGREPRQAPARPVRTAPVAPVAAASPESIGVPDRHFRPPATGRHTGVAVVDLLVRLIGTTLRADPEDRAGRVRGQLRRLDGPTIELVLARARERFSATQFGQLQDAVAASRRPAGGESLSTPAPGAQDEATQEAAATPGRDADEVASATSTDSPAGMPAGVSASLPAGMPATLAQAAGGVWRSLVSVGTSLWRRLRDGASGDSAGATREPSTGTGSPPEAAGLEPASASRRATEPIAGGRAEAGAPASRAATTGRPPAPGATADPAAAVPVDERADAAPADIASPEAATGGPPAISETAPPEGAGAVAVTQPDAGRAELSGSAAPKAPGGAPVLANGEGAAGGQGGPAGRAAPPEEREAEPAAGAAEPAVTDRAEPAPTAAGDPARDETGQDSAPGEPLDAPGATAEAADASGQAGAAEAGGPAASGGVPATPAAVVPLTPGAAPLVPEPPSETADPEPVTGAVEHDPGPSPDVAQLGDDASQPAEAPPAGALPDSGPPATPDTALAEAPDAPEMAGGGAPVPTAAPRIAAPEPADVSAPSLPTAAPQDTAADPAGPETAGPDTGQPETPGPEPAGPEPASPGPETGAPQAGGAPGAGCGSPPAPPAEPEPAAPGCSGGGGGGGGAGGGAAASAPAAETEAAAGDVSALPPDQALRQAAGRRPTAFAESLTQVGAAATHAVDQERSAQAAAPPTVAQPSGAAAGLDVSAPVPTPPDTAYAGPTTATAVAPGPGAAPSPEPGPAGPAAGAPTPVDRVAAPRLPGDGPLSAAQIADASRSVDDLPVTDPELAVDTGTVAPVDTAGEADPQLLTRQQEGFTAQADETLAQGRTDVAEPLGEADIRPHVPPRTMTAATPAGSSCPGLAAPRPAAGPAAGRHPRAAVDAVAAEEQGDTLRQAAQDGAGALGAARDRLDTDRGAAREQFDGDVQREVSDRHTEQVQARRDGIDASRQARGQWSDAQRTAWTQADRDASAAVTQGRRDEAGHRRDGAQTARGHLDDGNTTIAGERTRAEGTAREQRGRARSESRNGFLSWVGSRISAFLDGVRSAIRSAFDAARRAVRAAIDRARNLALAAIRYARDQVVAAIRRAGDLVVRAADVMLAAFPAARDRFRRRVRDAVERATELVNAAADALERGVQALLDAFARALDCALRYLEAGYLAAVDLVATGVRAALDAAQRALDALREWGEIIADVAADPMGWLRALGRAAMDGVRNCLWAALKRAVSEWFHSKVEAVVGVGRLIFNVLLRGCLTMAQIGRMAWDGIKAALPGILIQLLIEKLVSLLVPAGAALMLIIDGLRAAWGSVSRILAAFAKFMAFLRSVRSGRGAGPFAEMVASAAIAVLDFLSNFLVTRLRGAGQGVGNTLRAMASRLGAVGRVLRRAGGAIVRGARSVARRGMALARRGMAAVRRGVRAAGAAVRRVGGRAMAAARRGLARVGRALGRTRVGRYASRVATSVRTAVRRQTTRLRDWWRRRRRRRRQRETPQQRLTRAVGAIRPPLSSMLRRGTNGLWLRARLALWRLRYRLTSLRLVSSGRRGQIAARVNPEEPSVAQVATLEPDEALRIATNVVIRLLTDDEILRLAREHIRRHELNEPLIVTPETGGYASIAAMSGRIESNPFQSRRLLVGPDRHEVAYTRMWSRNPGETVVAQSRHLGSSYEDIDAAMRGGGFGSRYGGALHSMATTGRMPAGMDDQALTFARLSGLTHFQETRRRDTNLFFSAFGTKHVNASTGLADVLPLSGGGMGSAAWALRPIEAQRRRESPGTGPLAYASQRTQDAAVHELLRREGARAKFEMVAEVRAGGGIDLDPSQSLETFMETQLRRRLMLRIRIISAGGPAVPVIRPGGAR